MRRDATHYKQSQCIEQIIETLLQQTDIQPQNKLLRLRAAIKKAFDLHKDEPWVARWTHSDFDRTAVLINYMEVLSRESANIWDIRDQAGYWHSWIKSSSRDLIREINIIREWITRSPQTNSVLFLISELLKITRYDDSKGNWGKLILEIIDTENFKNSSELIESYGEYLISLHRPK